jgi:hypothetical protein
MKFKLISILFMIIIQSGCSGNSSSSSSSSNELPTSNEDSLIQGIGAGGSSYVLGTLDGVWLNGCVGGASGANYSYRDKITIKGTSISVEGIAYINNQTCSGGGDVKLIANYDADFGSYSSFGYGTLKATNYDETVTPTTDLGLTKLNSTNSMGFGNCSGGGFALNTAKICANNSELIKKYIIGDNMITFIEDYGFYSNQTPGISFFTDNFYKLVSSGDHNGSWGVLDSTKGVEKIIFSGNHFQYLKASTIYQYGAGDYVVLMSGSFSIENDIITLNIKTKILQSRQSDATFILNASSFCGLNSYADEKIVDLLINGNCSSKKINGRFSKNNTGIRLSLPALDSTVLPDSTGNLFVTPWHF